MQTICREGINVPINDHATIRDSVLVITGATYVLDVNVRIDNISHTWVSDLSIYLKSNLNTGIRLFNKTATGQCNGNRKTIYFGSGIATLLSQNAQKVERKKEQKDKESPQTDCLCSCEQESANQTQLVACKKNKVCWKNHKSKRRKNPKKQRQNVAAVGFHQPTHGDNGKGQRKVPL